MGYWKDVDLTMQSGIDRKDAEIICAKQRYGNPEEKKQANKDEYILIQNTKIKSLNE